MFQGVAQLPRHPEHDPLNLLSRCIRPALQCPSPPHSGPWLSPSQMVMLVFQRADDTVLVFSLFIPLSNVDHRLCHHYHHHQASRFLRGDWASGLGSESGFLCQGYPVTFYTLSVGVIIIIIHRHHCNPSVQGASILSLMSVTLLKASLLFGGSKTRQLSHWVGHSLARVLN